MVVFVLTLSVSAGTELLCQSLFLSTSFFYLYVRLSAFISVLSVCDLSVCLSIFLFVCPVYLFLFWLSVYLSVSMSHLTVCGPSVCLSVYGPSVCLYVCISQFTVCGPTVCLSVCGPSVRLSVSLWYVCLSRAVARWCLSELPFTGTELP